jgi:hypothetical protein
MYAVIFSCLYRKKNQEFPMNESKKNRASEKASLKYQSRRLVKSWCWRILLCFCLLIILVMVIPPRFSDVYFRQIKLGFSEKEIVVILGFPPGDYRPMSWKNASMYLHRLSLGSIMLRESGIPIQDIDLQLVEHPFSQDKFPITKKEWIGRYYAIRVVFDYQGKAIHSSIWKVIPPPAPPGDLIKIRWWLGF